MNEPSLDTKYQNIIPKLKEKLNLQIGRRYVILIGFIDWSKYLLNTKKRNFSNLLNQHTQIENKILITRKSLKVETLHKFAKLFKSSQSASHKTKPY